MNNSLQVFQRIEKKYLLSPSQYKALATALQNTMEYDSYGLHTICNLYYDTPQYDLIRHSIDKPVYKEKLRLRSYGTPRESDQVFVELKKKYKGIVYKRRALLSLAHATAFLSGGRQLRQSSQVLREIEWFLGYYQPEAKVYLAYDRLALFGKEDEAVRVTFDQNIRFRDHSLDLAQGSRGKSLLDTDHILMEVKVPQSMPVWMSRLFSELSIQPTSFSKYGMFYKQYLHPDRAVVCQGGIAHAS